MITLPAYFGDPEKQRAFVELLAQSAIGGKIDGSLYSNLATKGCDRVALYNKTGFPVSLLEVIDQIYLRLVGYDASEFAIKAFSVVKSGRNVTDLGWNLVEHAVVCGLAREGEAFAAAARQAPAIFPRLCLSAFTEKQLQHLQHESARKALKMGHQTPSTLRDPRVAALLNAAIRGGEGNAGAVVQWTIAHAPDPEVTVQSHKRKLLEMLEAA
jgi:hypothetical protein